VVGERAESTGRVGGAETVGRKGETAQGGGGGETGTHLRCEITHTLTQREVKWTVVYSVPCKTNHQLSLDTLLHCLVVLELS